MTENEIEETSQNQLIADIAYEQVIKIVPIEEPLFTAIKDQYFEDPESILRCEAGEGEKLDFGISAAFILMTPVILVVVEEIIKFITEEVKNAFKEESSSFIHDKVKKMFRKYTLVGEEQEKAPALKFELEKVRNVAVSAALKHNIPLKEAELLADSVVSNLVIGTATNGAA